MGQAAFDPAAIDKLQFPIEHVGEILYVIVVPTWLTRAHCVRPREVDLVCSIRRVMAYIDALLRSVHKFPPFSLMLIVDGVLLLPPPISRTILIYTYLSSSIFVHIPGASEPPQAQRRQH